MHTNKIEHFVDLVRGFVSIIENVDDMQAYDLLFQSSIYLPQIYAFGMLLDDVEPESSEPETYTGNSLMGVLIDKIGKYDNYSEVFDPVVDSELVMGSLSDDLTDIYGDLKGPLLAYDQGRISDALWQWKFNLRTHCGDHLVDSLRAIHRLVNDHMDPDYIKK